jgi:hypothetical protein
MLGKTLGRKLSNFTNVDIFCGDRNFYSPKFRYYSLKDHLFNPNFSRDFASFATGTKKNCQNKIENPDHIHAPFFLKKSYSVQESNNHMCQV